MELKTQRDHSRKYTNNWKLHKMLFNYQWVIEEIREEIKRFLEFNENENNLSELVGTQKRQ
jgi:hypothetical protein